MRSVNPCYYNHSLSSTTTPPPMYPPYVREEEGSRREGGRGSGREVAAVAAAAAGDAAATSSSAAAGATEEEAEAGGEAATARCTPQGRHGHGQHRGSTRSFGSVASWGAPTSHRPQLVRQLQTRPPVRVLLLVTGCWRHAPRRAAPPRQRQRKTRSVGTAISRGAPAGGRPRLVRRAAHH